MCHKLLEQMMKIVLKIVQIWLEYLSVGKEFQDNLEIYNNQRGRL